jgi:type II secretory pathway component PulK
MGYGPLNGYAVEKGARDKSDAGIALVAVLWTLVLLSLIAALVSFETGVGVRVSRNAVDKAVTRAAAQAGIERAILELASEPSLRDDRWHRDGTGYDWRFAGRIVRISIRDESSKVNVNTASDALLTSLLISVGVDREKAQSLSDAIADYRDKDNLPRYNGAEQAEYRAAGLSRGPKNAPFETVDELQQVLGMTTEIYNRMSPDLTVYSWGTVDPTLASDRVTAVLRRSGFQNFTKAQGMTYSIRAEAKSSNGATSELNAILQVFPRSRIPIRILSWRTGAMTNSRNPLA